MDDEMDFYCAQKFSQEVLEAINGDELAGLDVSGTSEPDVASLNLMVKARRLALLQGIRVRFVSHGS